MHIDGVVWYSGCTGESLVVHVCFVVQHGWCLVRTSLSDFDLVDDDDCHTSRTCCPSDTALENTKSLHPAALTGNRRDKFATSGLVFVFEACGIRFRISVI